MYHQVMRKCRLLYERAVLGFEEDLGIFGVSLVEIKPWIHSIHGKRDLEEWPKEAISDFWRKWQQKSPF
jgi:hypothetical protein